MRGLRGVNHNGLFPRIERRAGRRLQWQGGLNKENMGLSITKIGSSIRPATPRLAREPLSRRGGSRGATLGVLRRRLSQQFDPWETV
jgi:hypothetical protein